MVWKQLPLFFGSRCFSVGLSVIVIGQLKGARREEALGARYYTILTIIYILSLHIPMYFIFYNYLSNLCLAYLTNIIFIFLLFLFYFIIILYFFLYFLLLFIFIYFFIFFFIFFIIFYILLLFLFFF